MAEPQKGRGRGGTGATRRPSARSAPSQFPLLTRLFAPRPASHQEGPGLLSGRRPWAQGGGGGAAWRARPPGRARARGRRDGMGGRRGKGGGRRGRCGRATSTSRSPPLLFLLSPPPALRPWPGWFWIRRSASRAPRPTPRGRRAAAPGGLCSKRQKRPFPHSRRRGGEGGEEVSERRESGGRERFGALLYAPVCPLCFSLTVDAGADPSLRPAASGGGGPRTRQRNGARRGRRGRTRLERSGKWGGRDGLGEAKERHARTGLERRGRWGWPRRV